MVCVRRVHWFTSVHGKVWQRDPGFVGSDTSGRVCARLHPCTCPASLPVGALVPLFCRRGARSSSAESVPVGQLWRAGQAETSPDTARATCERLRAGPAGPLAYPGRAPLLCKAGSLWKRRQGCGPALQPSRLLGPRITLTAVLSGICLGKEGSGGHCRARPC